MIFQKENINSSKETELLNSDQYAKIIYDMAKRTLKENFYRFFNLYYESLITGNYNYVVLVTRRAYVLYEIFLLCMKALGRPEKVQSQVVTSDGIYMLGFEDKDQKNYKECSFLILDDIIINGRTILNVFNNLKSLDITNIGIASIEMYENATFLQGLNLECLNDIPKVSEKMWKCDSDALTNLIISSNIGYTSFVPSYIFDDYSDEYWKLLLEFFEQRELKSIESETLKQNEIEAKALFFTSQDTDILNDEDYETQICIRLYYNRKNKKLTVIPYCFCQNVLVNECLDFCNTLLLKTGCKFSQKVLDFINNSNKKEQFSLLYKYTINHVCEFAFELFFKKLDEVLKKQSFYIKHPYEYFINYHSWIEKKQPEEEIGCFSKRKELIIETTDFYYEYAYNCFFQTIDKAKKQRVNLLSFLNSIKSFDDNNAKQKNGEYRCIGIQISDIYDGFNKIYDNYNYQSLLLLVIGLWDDGTAGYNYTIVNSKNGESVICGFLKNGEQIYNKIYLLYSDVYSYFYRLYNKTSIYRLHELEDFAEYMQNHTQDDGFLDLLNEIKKGSEEHYFSDLGSVVPRQICHKFDEAYDNYLCEHIYI